MVLALKIPAMENIVPPCSRLSSFKHGKYQWNRGRCTYMGEFLDGEFHGSGVLHNTYFLKGENYACRRIFEGYDPECFSMWYVQPNGVTIHLSLTYEGHFENGMRHGRGTLSLRPFTPSPETDNFRQSSSTMASGSTTWCMAEENTVVSQCTRGGRCSGQTCPLSANQSKSFWHEAQSLGSAKTARTCSSPDSGTTLRVLRSREVSWCVLLRRACRQERENAPFMARSTTGRWLVAWSTGLKIFVGTGCTLSALKAKSSATHISIVWHGRTKMTILLVRNAHQDITSWRWVMENGGKASS